MELLLDRLLRPATAEPAGTAAAPTPSNEGGQQGEAQDHW